MLLKDKFQNQELILASKSPRRHDLLKLLGLDFKVQLFDVEELRPEHLINEEIPIYLSQLKAQEAQKHIENNQFVITADTIVVLGDSVLEKPASKTEAITMLQQLSGTYHTVYTGLTVTNLEQQQSAFCSTKVYFRTLKEEEILFYVDHFQPFDKAGSYGIQEWVGAIGVSHIEGCYYNIMGLPLYTLHQLLLDF